MHLAGGSHDALVLVGLVVLLDVPQLVAVGAPESVGLAQALWADTPLPGDALPARPVAQVEAGHGGDGPAGGAPSLGASRSRAWMLSGMSSVRAISTKISGSSMSEGWKKAKQRRSVGSSRRRRSSQPWIACTAS